MATLNLQTKIVLYTTGVIVLVIFVFTGMNLWVDYSSTRAHQKKHLSNLAISIAPTVKSDLQYRRTHELRRTVRSFSYMSEIRRLDILGPDFQNLSSTASTDTIREQVASTEGSQWEKAHIWDNGDTMTILAPVRGDLGDNLGYVHIVASTAEETFILRQKLARGLIFGGFFGILGCIVGLYAGKRLTRPLVRLTDAAESLGRGKSPDRIEAKSRDELGQLVDAFNTMVEKRSEAEASLERSRQHLLFVLRETPLGYIEWDLDCRVLSWNKAAERIFGYTEAEARGRPAFELIIPEDMQEEMSDLWHRTSNAHGATESLSQNIRADGERIMCHWNNTVIRNPSGRVTAVASLINDVTENIETQEQMRQAMEAAQNATRAKSDFLANMSHEIRTPMNGVIGLTELLLESELNEDQRSYLEVIRSSGEMLLTIINDILDLSKIESGMLHLSERSFELKESLNGAFQLFDRQLKQKGLTCDVSLDDSLPDTVYGDPVRLRQIVYNLISNAVKFTESGSITMWAWAEPKDETTIQLYVTVRDTGTGIDPSRLDLIFQPFSQADTSSTRSFGGTGLGLTICKRLCKMMDGDIQIDSTSQEGTQFSFNISLSTKIAKIASEDNTRLKHLRETAAQDGLNILVVEDNAVNRLVTKRILGRLGLRCTTATDGQEAVDEMRTSPFDIIFMDLQMPNMDGITATRIIREEHGSNPVIIALTASAVEGDRERCLNNGMDDYLPKPINIESVERLIERFTRLAGDPS